MNQFDSVLKMYAEAGMRTQEDWSLAGREIMAGCKARASAPLRGALVELYTRDQTQIRPKVTIP